MWRFDQGRIEYFQFDEIRKLAKYAIAHDLKSSKRDALVAATGLPFLPASEDYPPWRNYSRVFRTSMLVAEVEGHAKPTKIAYLLAEDGKITSDEYFHFLAQTFTAPAPSFQEWTPTDSPRFPLLFSLKYLLAKATIGENVVSYSDIISAYETSGFDGDEDQSAFIIIARKTYSEADNRQARESIQVISQISYLSATSTTITISLDSETALDVFESLAAVRGSPAPDRESEILRLAGLYESAVSGIDLDYTNTAADQVIEAGFSEGTRVERTHIVLERNAGVRNAFFAENPTADCDFCGRDTQAEFPWVDRVLDIHHVLPLCSGTRSTKKGTDLTDLVAVCPTCHRAVHRYYAKWLKSAGRKDFVDANEAKAVYDAAKHDRKSH